MNDKIVKGICFRHVLWFVLGALEEYNQQGLCATRDFQVRTVDKVWDYLVKDDISLDSSYSDVQCRIALEAGKVFFTPVLRRPADT